MSRQEVLVDADWVEEHRGDDNIVLVEVDEDTTAYDGGHIAGAIKLDWKTDLQDPVRRDFVNKEQFETLLSERGISNDDTVVLYGGNNNWFAAYAYWYFKLYGHQNVKLLDGGRKKWELDARELTTETVTRPATATRGRAEPDIRAFRDEVVAGHRHQEPGRRPHPRRVRRRAPGPPTCRRSRPSAAATSPRGQRAVEQGGQRRRHLQVGRGAQGAYGDAGLDRDADIIAYCRIGERSAHTWFVLHEILGTRTSRTTTAHGPNTAPWSTCRSTCDEPREIALKLSQPSFQKEKNNVRSN